MMNTGSPTEETGNATFSVDYLENPNRLWAFPVLGGMVKVIVVIPIGFWLLIVAVAAMALSVINGFIVLFTGTYWGPAHALAVGLMRLSAKARCFFLGLSDTYPGFSLDSSDGVRLAIAMPREPNRFFALPLVGGIVRYAILVPIFIFLFVLGLLVMVVYWFTWIPVLLIGKYPEGLFRLMVFTQRFQLKLTAYIFGLSDRYPLLDEGLGPDEWGPGRHDRVFRPLGPDTFG